MRSDQHGNAEDTFLGDCIPKFPAFQKTLATLRCITTTEGLAYAARAAVSKTVDLPGLAGSNPVPSVVVM